MPELRKDPVTGRWVIIAKERAKRPTDFIVEPEPARGGFCPFCPGHEYATPPEVLGYRPKGSPPNGPGWSLRVTPNKFPVLVVEGALERLGEGMYDKMSGIGAHEIIIETPEHGATLATMPPEKLQEIVQAYRDRLVDLAGDKRFRYVLVFKNFGARAGAFLEHSYSQLVALPVVPKLVMAELEGSLTHFRYKERCVFCDIIRQELREGSRLVCENRDFLALTPYAPRSPFEVWILPKAHQASFSEVCPEDCGALGAVFSEVMRRLAATIGEVPYNFMLHTAPLRETTLEHYHWHFEIMPRLTLVAGFEWGSGFYINPTPPEHAARFLGEAKVTGSVSGAGRQHPSAA